MRPTATETVQIAAQEAHPAECCGLLLGRARESAKSEIVRAVPTRNAAPQPQRGYAIDPADLLAIETEAAAAGLDVVGAFHSHPNGDASPSAHDERMAVPGWTYAVAACARGRVPKVRWFHRDLDDDSLEEVPAPEQR